MSNELQRKIEEIARDAIAARWPEVEPLLLPIVQRTLGQVGQDLDFQGVFYRAIRDAVEASMKEQLATTLKSHVDALAKDKAMKDLRSKAQRRGMKLMLGEGE